MNEILLAGAIVSVCLLLHVTGVLAMAEWLLRRREFIKRRNAKTHYAVILILLFTGIMLLHVTEAILWAVFYYSRSLFHDFETAVYFSLTCYTTIGFGDVLLPQRWRLLGPIEAVSGVLLCGVSTAFIFAVINAMLQIRLQAPSTLSEVTVSNTHRGGYARGQSEP